MTQIIDLGKLRFHFAGEWLDASVYEPNDVVKYGGNIYVYIYGMKMAGNLPTLTSHWALMVKGFDFNGVFDAATAYRVGEAISYGGKVYISIADSVGQVPPNSAVWSQFVDGIQFEGEYAAETAFQKNHGGQPAKRPNLLEVVCCWRKPKDSLRPGRGLCQERYRHLWRQHLRCNGRYDR
jgi:hypothetical protein